jgi:hypothetical protein
MPLPSGPAVCPAFPDRPLFDAEDDPIARDDRDRLFAVPGHGVHHAAIALEVCFRSEPHRVRTALADGLGAGRRFESIVTSVGLSYDRAASAHAGSSASEDCSSRSNIPSKSSRSFVLIGWFVTVKLHPVRLERLVGKADRQR